MTRSRTSCCISSCCISSRCTSSHRTSPRSIHVQPGAVLRRFGALCVFLVLALVLVACSAKSTLPSRPFYSGSEGILLSFPQANLLRQYQNDSFVVSVRLENDGVATVSPSNPGFLLASFDPAVLSLRSVTASLNSGERATLEAATAKASCAPDSNGVPSSACIAFAARGRTPFIPIGDVVFGEFTFQSKQLADNRERATSPLTIHACYPYTTTFIANVCVDRDNVQGSLTNAPCEAVTVSAQPQGAPVAVTAVKPRYLRTAGGVNARYEIELRNLKDGLIIHPTDPKAQSWDVCNLERLNREDFGFARVSANLSTIPLSCGFDNSGTARFFRGEATVVCQYTGDLPGTLREGVNYEAPLIVILNYYYIQKLSTTVEVLR